MLTFAQTALAVLVPKGKHAALRRCGHEAVSLGFTLSHFFSTFFPIVSVPFKLPFESSQTRL